jgi:hypothetical protein
MLIRSSPRSTWLRNECDNSACSATWVSVIPRLWRSARIRTQRPRRGCGPVVTRGATARGGGIRHD